jgi:hypothetical protein
MRAGKTTHLSSTPLGYVVFGLGMKASVFSILGSSF